MHYNLLENGGTVLVIGGMAKSWESFRSNPRIVFWSGEQKEIARHVRNREIPANCKAVIISRFMSHSEIGQILSEARRRRIVLFPNKNDGEVSNVLESLLSEVPKVMEPEVFTLPVSVKTVEKEEEEIMAKKRTGGVQPKLTPILQYVDWSKSNAENARAILKVAAKDLGIETTFGSLSQFLMVNRKKLGHSNVARVGTPRGAHKKEKTVKVKTVVEDNDPVMQMFDEAINNLNDIRDFLVKTVAENAELKSQTEKFAPLVAMMKALK